MQTNTLKCDKAPRVCWLNINNSIHAATECLEVVSAM
jgi:hypothetical protein